jgi:hypothetical protein
MTRKEVVELADHIAAVLGSIGLQPGFMLSSPCGSDPQSPAYAAYLDLYVGSNPPVRLGRFTSRADFDAMVERARIRAQRAGSRPN